MCAEPITDDRAGDGAVAALAELTTQLDRTMRELALAIDRANQLAALRSAGRSWSEIVQAEEPPLIVERISRALADLGEAGSCFRREEARALREEGLSITEISRLFGVTRQRVSALVNRDPVELRPAGRPRPVRASGSSAARPTWRATGGV